MNETAAKNLVKTTFENPYSRERFLTFAKNLFHFFEPKTFVYRGKYIPDAYKIHVKTLERLGKYEDQDNNKIDILVVCLKKPSSLERARTMQRNFIAWYLNGSRGNVAKDAALVAFYAKDSNDWRLSLVKMDYSLAKSKAGKIKAITELTPARRFSFSVGKDENTHTAQRQLLPVLQKDDHPPKLADLETAFSVEVVTKDFFEKYKALFLSTKEALDKIVAKDAKIKSDFIEKNIDTVDFTKKLLGQIVFLYFLQKKGWFGVARDKDWGTGPKDFLRRLFEKKLSDYDNFFNDILEPLFYEALAIERPDDFYSKFNCKIPFLNGGLFDPLDNYDWIHTDILLNNNLFSNSTKTKEGDIGDGILDVFDRYNFTVKEDEPLEREVAVDPEMLGKVFENLLEVKDRKSKGTYYTPREIVHYMCQESLVNYLITESKLDEKTIRSLVNPKILTQKEYHEFRRKGGKKNKLVEGVLALWKEEAKKLDKILKDIRVCDPACGSGAFLIGMLQEIISARERLAFALGINTSSYELKRYAVQNSLYGVDIDLGAVEIAKLRLWLSLIVDEEDIKNIRPLPNLDYKIMQGNSLIELLSPSLLVRTPDHKRNELIDELNKARNEFFNTFSPSLKKKKRKEINVLTRSLLNYDKEKEKASLLERLLALRSQPKLFKEKHEQTSLATIEKEEKLKKKIDEYKKLQDTSSSDHFEWHLNFNEVFDEKGGFDVLIANPPYIGQKGSNLLFRPIKESVLGIYHQRRMDLFYFFFHLALNIGKLNSTICFITTNYYPTATYADKLRKDLKKRSIVKHLIDFNELKIFESATGQHNMITIFQKNNDQNSIANTCITHRKGLANSDILQQIVNGKDEESEYYKVLQKNLYDGDECYIRLRGSSTTSKNTTQYLLNKVKGQGEILRKVCNISTGVQTGADRVTQKSIEKYNLHAKVGEGIFVLSEKENAKLNLNSIAKQFLKPWFKNSDLYRWGTKKESTEKIIYYTSKEKLNIGATLKNHFKRYKIILINRNARSGTGVITNEDYASFVKGTKYISYVMIASSFKQGKYYCVSYARDSRVFDGAKIVAPQRSPKNTFGYNDIPWYASADVYFITEKDKNVSLKYVLALLNSKSYYLWLYHRGKRKGETLELYQKPLSEIPIKKISPEGQKPYIEIVNKILAVTKSDDYLENPEKQSQVKEYEKQIDRMVYKLYDLTSEEIEIVEGENAN